MEYTVIIIKRLTIPNKHKTYNHLRNKTPNHTLFPSLHSSLNIKEYIVYRKIYEPVTKPKIRSKNILILLSDFQRSKHKRMHINTPKTLSLPIECSILQYISHHSKAHSATTVNDSTFGSNPPKHHSNMIYL